MNQQQEDHDSDTEPDSVTINKYKEILSREDKILDTTSYGIAPPQPVNQKEFDLAEVVIEEDMTSLQDKINNIMEFLK